MAAYRSGSHQYAVDRSQRSHPYHPDRESADQRLRVGYQRPGDVGVERRRRLRLSECVCDQRHDGGGGGRACRSGAAPDVLVVESLPVPSESGGAASACCIAPTCSSRSTTPSPARAMSAPTQPCISRSPSSARLQANVEKSSTSTTSSTRTATPTSRPDSLVTLRVSLTTSF